MARYYASAGDQESVVRIADALLTLQADSGGWVVRSDYLGGITTPMLAPNDSAYIASNALLPAYKMSRLRGYLDAAIRCGEWIMTSALEDGMVPFGYNMRSSRWVTDVNIVDVGFTADLFVKLYEVTNRAEFRDFALRFLHSYMDRFRDPEDGAFATSIDARGRQNRSRFARGQAWALEGIVPAAFAFQDDRLYTAAEQIVAFLVRAQRKDGGWAYNLSRPLSGVDCKGVSVISKSLANWGMARGRTEVLDAAARGLNWCRDHTELGGETAGLIVSYSQEGAVTHSHYSRAGFVYASSYALETQALLSRI